MIGLPELGGRQRSNIAAQSPPSLLAGEIAKSTDANRVARTRDPCELDGESVD
jgi:hypothetical protein